MTDTTDTAKKVCSSRQDQILDAATGCFCQQGFHGASIASISKSAGMSPGHIYHYFENKEAIIAAIVERDMADILDNIARIQRQDDILQGLLDSMLLHLTCKNEQKKAALKIEVLAEAARNPKVSEMMRRVDQIVSGTCRQFFVAARGDRPPLDEEEMTARAEIMGALFSGLTIRSLYGRTLDQEALVKVLRHTIKSLIVD
ncbi:TetR/AcrR family transcriptional regulator [Uliginosibacterium gangwonense]|uniref:TetR/AcrR family transcriptional regulator n=1 Tax=Uliginosibacterium gangwonense TaxID=392736 RepID=UPI00037918F6|nr:TetR/AcrR family transcriptional regulator [Uliginosibacterium gangwonense]